MAVSGTGIILTTLMYQAVLPLTLEYILFYSVLGFLFCLWRPSWGFFVLLAFLPLEIVTLTPESLGMDLRPYQWVALLLGLAVGVQSLTRRIHWPLFHWNWLDTMLVLLVGVCGLSALVAQGIALKQALVLASFLYLYFLGRVFLKTRASVSVALPFFVIPAVLSLGWGVMQNILFLLGKRAWAVMPGRPNGTLAEPDWLGLLVVFLLIPCLAWLIRRIELSETWKNSLVPLSGLMSLFIVLMLTVSRSAWLAALVSIGLMIGLVYGKPKQHSFEFAKAFFLMQLIVVAFGVALILVQTIPLSRFVLGERALSTASQYQTITVACQARVALPNRIQSLDELSQYGCEHILLEEQPARIAKGQQIMTTERPDPNIGIRKMIYRQSLESIREHPWLGIGWGSIGPRLGTDERGAHYNASNLFLEVSLGGGIMALAFTVALIGLMVWSAGRQWWGNDQDAVLWAAALLSLGAGFLVFNLFNTGLLLGFVWFWLALFSVRETSSNIHSPHAV